MRRPIITQAWLAEFYAEGVKSKYKGGLKRQATSNKQPKAASRKRQAAGHMRLYLEAASNKHNLRLQATSYKHQAPSEDRYKLQASSDKQQAS